MKKLLDTVFYSVITTLVVVSAYLLIGLVGSLTMLDTSYMIFYEWPVPVRFMYVVFSLYILVRAVAEDFNSWGNGN